MAGWWSTPADFKADRERMGPRRWQQLAASCEAVHWRNPDPCPHCGEWVGHFGGSVDRDPCPMIPEDCPLEELRPNCYAVRRMHIADAIRAACKV